jgi:hypothetical protein
MPPGYFFADMRRRLIEKETRLRAEDLAAASSPEARRIRKEIAAKADAEIERLYPEHRLSTAI